MALALRIEASLSKEAILEAYLNHVEFGPGVRGAEAGARWYFDKAAADLSLGEAAALASLPRGPTLYDPRRHPELLQRRRDRVLDRMLDAGLATDEEVRLAKSEAIVTLPRFRTASAPHFVAALLEGQLDPCAPEAALPTGTVEVRTTLVADLQREVTEAAKDTVDELAEHGVSAASVVVLENATGDVLAYVGSPDVTDARRLGGNDGVRALRQPGSALKPFVYELAFERLGMAPATVLPDVELTFPTAEGPHWRPRNYDERFHGPVSARDALGSSFNVPAVWLADRLGPSEVLARLRELGLCSLSRDAADYGLGLALGDGEVRLLELARAYATLARGGTVPPVRGLLGALGADGRALALPPAASAPRVLREREAFLVADVLRDARARQASFGEASVLDLPFEVAAKTGTSKGFRDNLTVGFTPEVTVAVWVGNFDGSPMRGVSGITGAGPLFHRAMLAAARVHAPTEAVVPDGIDEVEVCPLSGGAPGPDCPHVRGDRALADSRLEPCDVHVRVHVDPRNGLLAGPACADARVERVERLPPIFEAWARSTGRPAPPDRSSPRCPDPAAPSEATVRLLEPQDGARFYLDPGAAGVARVRLRAVFPAEPGRGFVVDGRTVPADALGEATIPLVPGTHRVQAAAGAARSEPATFTVR